jgi:crotonobetainyl-CoA:carnitine CoA-transferase CaiB-like acyl-CoA transferase
VTGFGQDGPRRDQAAYDFAIQAMGGLMSVTGERDDAPGGGPQKVGVPIVDIMTGMYAAIAVLAALARRAETGSGETIDLAMLDVQAAFLANQAMNWLVSGRTPKRGGNRHPNIQPQDVFPCRDGHLVLAVGNDGQFAKLCEAIGRPEWVRDARFAANPERVRNNAVLTPLLAERFRDFMRADLAKALDDAGVPCAPINDIPQVFDDPQLRHRGMLRELSHPLAGKVPQVISPMRFADAPLRFDRAPPLLGQHSAEILAELGLDEQAVAALAARGVT